MSTDKKKNSRVFNKAKRWALDNGHDIDTLMTEGMKLKKSSVRNYKSGAYTNAGLKLLAYLKDN